MRLVIVLLAGGVVALGVSCSNGSADSKSTGEEPESWTHAWCVALRDFQNDNLARAADLRRRLASSSSAAEARAEIVDYYADGAARIDRFLADVKRLGVPAVNDGASLVHSTLDLYANFRAVVVRARDRATRLPSAAARFTTENRRIARSVLVASQRLTSKLGDWDEEHPTSAVQTAYRKDAECRRLRAVK